MRQLIALGFAVTLLAGCLPEYEQQDDPALATPMGEAGVSVPDELEDFKTSELGTDLTRDPAKTIAWLDTGNATGTGYLSGAVVIDRVVRNDALGIYGVDVRLKNTTGSPLSIDYRLEFVSSEGETILGIRDDWQEGRRVDWRKSALDPYGLLHIAGAARMRHAVGFRLYVRPAGAKTEGYWDMAPTKLDISSLKREIEE